MKNFIDRTDWSQEDLQALESERNTINEIDQKILELLNKRAQSSIKIGEIKKKASTSPMIYDAKREGELLENLFILNKNTKGIVQNFHIENIWREIMSASKDLQNTLHSTNNS